MHPSFSKNADTETLSSQAHSQFVRFNAVHFMSGAASEHRHIPRLGMSVTTQGGSGRQFVTGL